MATHEELAQVFSQMVERFKPEKAEGVEATIQFDLSGENGGMYWFKIENGTCVSGEGAVENPKLTVSASGDAWFDIASGKANVMQAFMGGKLKVKGDMGLGMKLQSMFGL